MTPLPVEGTAAQGSVKLKIKNSSSSDTPTVLTGTSSGSVSSYYSQSQSDKVYINGEQMSVYDAVCRIVRYEAGVGQPDEHVKAQAVATYTYIRNGGNDLSTGIKPLSDVTQQIKDCVAEVIGYAVLDDKSNDFILATYFSESCGVTADAEWVWGYANRNLLSVSSPVDGKTATTKSISSAEFASKVLSKAKISLTGNPANWIEPKSYWKNTKYVNEIYLGGQVYSARKLRETVLGSSWLRSTAFSVKYNAAGDTFDFTTYGYGHGVGMSAVGSIEYAKQGYTWDKILLKYYSNCYIGMKTK